GVYPGARSRAKSADKRMPRLSDAMRCPGWVGFDVVLPLVSDLIIYDNQRGRRNAAIRIPVRNTRKSHAACLSVCFRTAAVRVHRRTLTVEGVSEPAHLGSARRTGA